MKYQFKFTRTFTKVIEVEANSESEAEEMADKYEWLTEDFEDCDDYYQLEGVDE